MLCIRYNYSVVVLAALRYTHGACIWYQYTSLHPTHGTTLFRKQFELVEYLNWWVLNHERYFLGHVRLSRKKRSTSSSRRFRSFLAERGRRGPRRPDSPLVHPGARTHGEIRGRNAPARFWYGASFLSSVWWLRALVVARWRTRAHEAYCVHTQSKRKFPTHCTQQKQQQDNNDLFAAAAADRPNSSSCSTQQQRATYRSFDDSLPSWLRVVGVCHVCSVLLGHISFVQCVGGFTS